MLEADWEFPEKLGFLFDPYRYKVAHGGRGGAKSWGFGRALLAKGEKEPLRIMCAREVQNSIADSVHALLSDQIQSMGLGSHYRVLEREIRGINGTQLLFAGLSKLTAESIKSYEGIDIVWVEEAHKVTRRSWDILIPTIRKNESEIWITLNPELDTDETWVRFVENPPPHSKVVKLDWRDNPWFPQVLEEERLEFLRLVALGKRSQDDYDWIWEGQTKAAVEGAIYHREIVTAKAQGRLRNVPYDPLLRVHNIWDLGWNDKMCVLMVQKAASEIRIIDYIEDSHRTYAEYDAQLRAKPYRFGKDYLPHDAKAKSAESGRSAQDILGKQGLGRDVEIVEDIGIENGIRSARQLFARVYFDKEKAALLFNRLGRYKRAINQTTHEAGAPLHDENSHGADGFRYLAVVADKLVNEERVIADPYASFRRAG